MQPLFCFVASHSFKRQKYRIYVSLRANTSCQNEVLVVTSEGEGIAYPIAEGYRQVLSDGTFGQHLYILLLHPEPQIPFFALASGPTLIVGYADHLFYFDQL